MLAYVRDGRIKWIEGNPADVLGGEGKICVKGASAMRVLYDPDRLKWPLKRTNPKKGKDEDPGWVKISWELPLIFLLILSVAPGLLSAGRRRP